MGSDPLNRSPDRSPPRAFSEVRKNRKQKMNNDVKPTDRVYLEGPNGDGGHDFTIRGMTQGPSEGTRVKTDWLGRVIESKPEDRFFGWGK